MKIVALSDTHGQHRTMKNLPDGDVLVFAGDMGVHGTMPELQDFATWFADFPHEHKIMIAGNHDFCFDHTRQKEDCRELLEEKGIIYLEEETVTIEGVKFYGSPFSNTFDQYVFCQGFGDIPEDTDVLLTHGPPEGRNDYLEDYGHIGSEELREEVDEFVCPRAHIYGHVHEQHGNSEDGVDSFNVSVTDVDYNRVFKPVVFEVETPQ